MGSTNEGGMGEKRLVMRQRKILKVGNSLAVVLPPPFIKECNLKRGEMLAVVMKNHQLRIIPMSE